MQNTDIQVTEAASASMKKLIAGLKPDREYYAGRIFFSKLLKESGPEGVMQFLDRASRAIDNSDGLDLHLHFDKKERAVFGKTYLNIWTRRAFLNTVAWAFPGAIYAAKGGIDSGIYVRDALRGGPTETATDIADGYAAAKASSQFISSHLYAPAELVIGLALINEAKEKWVEIKLEQVADAVETLAQKIALQESEKQSELSR